MKCSGCQFALFCATLLGALAACQRTTPALQQIPEAKPQSSPASATAPDAAEWAKARKLVRDKFPEVPQLSTEKLSAWLTATDQRPPLLLDARNENEYAVSHLQGAVCATSEQQALRALKDQPKDLPIVVYCSIGYRSSLLARKLTAQGYSNVKNLEGSIFAWANEGRPVYRGASEVKKVHPFNEQWGQLLKKEFWP